ncbi:MAG TPA: hypothetical protein PLY38_06440 [Candidatus Hydrothermia bacterium]|nr:hypothetical protein [Candidatus Hydrothermia bacterium]HRD23458.1 hypothetical protein [Candidatus Hydrothermia bacterium]
MKKRITVFMVALVTNALLVSSAGAFKPNIEDAAKKAIAEPTVEVLEVKIEKVTWESSIMGKMYGVNVTGKAVYHPAKVGGKPFVEASEGKEFIFALYDDKGMKLPVDITFDKSACGEYGEPENVIANEPFPFEKRVGIANEDEPDKIAIWEKVSSIKFVEWK